jgi:regulator of protease activity HflC (stomatin/prohibitin superfamily)
MNLRIQQLDVMIDTKTLDNVFVKMKISVQFQVIRTQVRCLLPFGKSTRPNHSYVFDVVRAEVPKLKLDDVFKR